MRKNSKMLGGAIVSAAILAVMATPNIVFADEPVETSINISGTVPFITSLPAAPNATGDNASYNSATKTASVTLAGSNAHGLNSSITIVFPEVSTNYPAYISVYSPVGSLTNSNGDKIYYVASAATSTSTTGICNFDGIADKLCATSTAAMIENENIELEITITGDSTAVLPAGTYSDTLHIKLGANL